jgi:hypothetical protein
MAKGRKTGGRRRGTPNYKTQAVGDRLQALGCDPIEGMARIAMDETVDLGVRAQMYKELARYVAPQLKATELCAGDGLVQVIISGEDAAL